MNTNYLRAELHNHTTESDGELTPLDLIHYMQEHNVDIFAVTDHNIVSGQTKIESLIDSLDAPALFVKGIEITTSYGHILVLGMETCFDFESISPKKGDLLLSKIRDNNGTLIGIAHPFCTGAPVLHGSRLAYQFSDYSNVDYIEVFNTTFGSDAQGNLLMGNDQALELWELLVLSGYNIAAVSGKDLHLYPYDEKVMTTYVSMKKPYTFENFVMAIKQQQTMVTMGPIVAVSIQQPNKLVVNIQSNQWEGQCKDTNFILGIKDAQGNTLEVERLSLDTIQEINLENLSERYVVRLYQEDTSFSNLIACGILIKNI